MNKTSIDRKNMALVTTVNAIIQHSKRCELSEFLAVRALIIVNVMNCYDCKVSQRLE